MSNDIVETFAINNRIVLYLLNTIDETSLADKFDKSRTIAEQFAHIHNVRLMWLKATAPDLMESIAKIDKENIITKQLLHDSLTASGLTIEALLQQGIETGKIKNFKPHPTAFLGYIISHESHHRGQIIWSLKANGHTPDKKILFGIWEWGVR
jgi:uncharacterized damage-inducible protein DinB